MNSVEFVERERIARIALEWERTPYVSEGRIKGQCADCTFFAKVYEEAGLIDLVPIPHYGPQAHLNRQASMYLGILMQYAHEIKREEIEIGDVVMFRIARTWSHGAMIIPPGWPFILHAWMPARGVIRGKADDGMLRNCEKRYFSFFNRTT